MRLERSTEKKMNIFYVATSPVDLFILLLFGYNCIMLQLMQWEVCKRTMWAMVMKDHRTI